MRLPARGATRIMGTMTTPRYTPLIASLPNAVPFVGPEAITRNTGRAFAARLGANESLFGPSPRAVEAMAQAATDSWMYGDSQNHDIRQALAAHHGVPADCIVMGGGIDGLLGSLVRLLVDPGDGVVTSAGAYPTFNFHVTGHGGVLHEVPFKDDHEDPDALIALAQKLRPKLIYIANPDNPMGTWHDAARMQAMIDALPEGGLLVLDEAYIEFAPQGTAPALNTDDPRVIRMRTFSKAYGLAGARVGYAIGQADLIKSFEKVRNHFGMARTSLAGAQAALEDQDWLHHVQAQVAEARDTLAQIARAHQLAPLPSATNFVTMDCGGDGALARRVVDELAQRGVFVRMPFVAPQDRCIRVTTAPAEVLKIFADALPEALKAAQTAS